MIIGRRTCRPPTILEMITLAIMYVVFHTKAANRQREMKREGNTGNEGNNKGKGNDEM
jgi:hypothetical protein